ncbi:MAG TPA: hypothetical protein VHR66_18530 [Gemmataceae bacterium]|nr:hypothetical protein [Gemmataceae bacterium]
MSNDTLMVLGYVGIGVALVAILWLLDSLLLGLANHFANRSEEFQHRIGTQLPRVLRQEATAARF